MNKTSIREKRQAANDDRAKHETENAAVEEVAKNTEVDIPSGMIDNEIEAMIRDMEQQLEIGRASCRERVYLCV